MSPVLETQGLTVRYGGIKALTDVSITVGQGELIGLIGPNGAGKTTFIDALTGFTRATGSVHLNGEDISQHKPHQRARKGLGRTWQSSELYDDLTVRENLEVSGYRPTIGQTVREVLTGRSSAELSVEHTLQLLDLAHLADAMPDELTQGQRKMVDVGRALAAGSAALCLDEPAAGLDSDESLELGRRLRRIVDNGASLLLVDHDMGLVLSVCDRVYVLDLGQLIAQGSPAEISSSQVVIDAYLGSDESTDGDPAAPLVAVGTPEENGNAHE